MTSTAHGPGIVLAALLLCGTLSAQEAAPGEVALKGPLLSAFHFKGQKLDGELIMYAFDGPPEVRATLNEVLDKYYPEEGNLNAEQALELQRQLDAKLRYYVDTRDPKIRTGRGYVCDYPVWLVSATGTIEERNGKKWIVNARITSENYVLWKKFRPSFEYPPKRMLQPRKPLVMPEGDPIVLKVDEELALKCVPIPPGTFIMGTPFYQYPRYQDECPGKVTLTKRFYMSETLITQDIWESVMGADRNVSNNRGPRFAVEFAPMPDIREFCRILSERNGRKVRLPTAAEMEYAAKLGTSGPEFPERNQDAWVMVGPPPEWKDQAVPVKTKPPNAWGLYDVFTEAVVAVSDWKAYNTPEDKVDPQGATLAESIIAKSVLRPKKPVENMIMKEGLPAIHKAVMGGGMKCRPGSHDRYTEDGCDGINGAAWVGVFRVVVEAP